LHYSYLTTAGGWLEMHSSQPGEVSIKQGCEGEIFKSFIWIF
jgi:hypothetical protein